MRIEFNRDHKSISAFDPIDLGRFTVITGENGAGKTHLLEAIAERKLNVVSPVIKDNEFKIVSSNDLQPAWRSDRVTLQKNPNKEAWDVFVEQRLPYLTQNLANAEFTLRQGLLRFGTEISVDKAIKAMGKPLLDITQEDFYARFVVSIPNTTMFSYNLTDLFLRYYQHQEQNSFDEFRAKKGQPHDPFLTEQQFEQKHGPPPWTILNSLFSEAGFPYTVDYPTGAEGTPYQPKIKLSNGAFIDPSSLSSGEKILVGFLISLYNLEDWRTGTLVPKVLLLDEIDAFLHPSLLRPILNAIQNVILAQFDMYIIMVTHSPTTVALVPEESIYLMKRGIPRLMKVSRDAAIAALTANVPTVSIKLENRRQVFVESEYDEELYSDIYSQLRTSPLADLKQDVSLTFIASGRGGQGNCIAVKHLVKSLNGKGNSSVFGIIDWDMSNVTNNQVFVVAPGYRYSLENLIFEPVLMLFLLLREHIIKPMDYGLPENTSHEIFRNLETKVIQQSVNTLLDKLLKNLDPEVLKETKEDTASFDVQPKTCYYLDGESVDLPRWYLCLQGHGLEKHWKHAFKEFRSFKNEGALKKLVVSRAFKEYPARIPREFKQVFDQIQRPYS
jgi:ABC-type uncharacterized transport system ATPase component